MHLDVVDLRQFYYRTQLGRIAQKAVRDRMRDLWPDGTRQTVVGFGFAVPLLRPFLPEARRVIALMPAEQGVMPWPAGTENIATLCREGLWPIQSESVDKLVVMHGLDTSEDPYAVLEECQRVLRPEGRALFIVPNRAGLWSRRDGTPFGFGRPYSAGQLEKQLADHDFIPERRASALYALPSEQRFWLRSADMIERMGRKIGRARAGGVVMLEVSKRVPARPRPGLAAHLRRPLRVLEGTPNPVGASAGRNGV